MAKAALPGNSPLTILLPALGKGSAAAFEGCLLGGDWWDGVSQGMCGALLNGPLPPGNIYLAVAGFRVNGLFQGGPSFQKAPFVLAPQL